MLRLVVLLAVISLACARATYVRGSKLAFGGRIAGGVNTTIEEHPYQVSFQSSRGHFCGGSLIAPNAVLTAAHCTYNKHNELEGLTVRAGSTYRNRGGVSLSLKSIHDHPKFNITLFDYDVSVLILDGSFELNESIQSIPLQVVNVEVPEKTLATMTGWGVLETNGSSPITLQVIEVPKVDQITCQINYPEEGLLVTDRMHCFGHNEGGIDACPGDSGGPLVVDGKLVGTDSWGYKDCAAANRPSVYAKIANKEINDFVHKIVDNFA